MLHKGRRTWKGDDRDAPARLRSRELIADPVNKAKSPVQTEAGLQAAERMFEALYAKCCDTPRGVRPGGVRARVKSAAGCARSSVPHLLPGALLLSRV
jgi:hypothetical protein